MPRVFLLSPAFAGGKRAKMTLNEAASFDLAVKLRAGEAELGEVFSFISGLYFRGKVAYAKAFAAPPAGVRGSMVIMVGQGLRALEDRVTADQLRAFGTVPLDLEEPRYREPLRRAAAELAGALGEECEVVLLGSVATGKYVEPLIEVFGERLLFPVEFVGRGDMSRGGLMLRCASEGRELEYAPVVGAVRRGRRPPKLPRLER